MAKAERTHACGEGASAPAESIETSNGNPQLLDTGSPPAAPKRKGGPVPGTPSPMRTRLSEELHAYARQQFEQTDQSVSDIALDCGVDESTIRRMALREGWVRYVPPPRDLPPVAKLLAQVEELEHAGDSNDGTREDNIERFIRIVMAHLDEFEAVRRAGKLIARQHLPTARAISTLTEAFNKLQRLRAAQPGQNHDDISDMPADLDAYRLELTRQIELFLRSRMAAGSDSRTATQSAESV